MPLKSRINDFTRSGSPKNGPNIFNPVVVIELTTDFDEDCSCFAVDERLNSSKRVRTKTLGVISGVRAGAALICGQTSGVLIGVFAKSDSDQIMLSKPCSSFNAAFSLSTFAGVLSLIDRSHLLNMSSNSRRYCVDLYACDSSGSRKSSSPTFSAFNSLMARCISMYAVAWSAFV